MNNRQSVSIVILLGLALAGALWAVTRLAGFQQQRLDTVVYADAPDTTVSAAAPRCGPAQNMPLDVDDYSFNVVKGPAVSRFFRYKTKLDAEPPVHVHILSIRGGSGRVVVSETDRPVWLVLLSQQPAIWHIDRAPGATVDRVVASHTVSELHFDDRLIAETGSLLTLLFGAPPEAAPLPDIEFMQQSLCLPYLQRFQKYEARKRFVPALRGLRAWLGHPEMSFQSHDHPSYFGHAFQVPFPEPQVSAGRLAAVAKLAEAPRNDTRAATAQATAAPVDEFARYANMPRREDVRAVTFRSSGEFLDVLESYRAKRLIPSSMPASGRGRQGLDVVEWYAIGEYRNAYTKSVATGTTPNVCRDSRGREFLIIEGTGGSNSVSCAWGKQLYFMRDGDDTIDDSWEDDIIYAGPGDDVIKAGWGNDLLFFNYGWGQDTVDKTCHRAAYRPQDAAGADRVDWSREWPYKNFIVFGKEVAAEDIVRINDKLVHKQTGDSITIEGDCFNTVFWE